MGDILSPEVAFGEVACDPEDSAVCLKLVLLFLEGSGSRVGNPVADVVVVQVLVDILLSRLGGMFLRKRFEIVEGFSPVKGISSVSDPELNSERETLAPPGLGLGLTETWLGGARSEAKALRPPMT